MNTFLGQVPLNQCREDVLVRKLSVTDQRFAGFTCSAAEDDLNCQVNSVRAFVSGLGLDPADYDVVVGVTQSSPCQPIAGCSNGTNTIWVLSQPDFVTAHEIGHIYGLEDEYCSNSAGSTDCRCNDGGTKYDSCTTDVNPLSSNDPYDCPGGRVERLIR